MLKRGGIICRAFKKGYFCIKIEFKCLKDGG